MLKLKDKLYVRNLIKKGRLKITEQDKLNLTEEDIKKIYYIEKRTYNYPIKFEVVKQFCFLHTLEMLIDFYDIYWYIIEDKFYKGFNWEKFADKIAIVYLKSVNDISYYLDRMLSKEYSIEQMEFLLKNNMLYSDYHDTFDYDVIFEECKKIGCDVKSKFCNDYPIDFLIYIYNHISVGYCKKILEAKPYSTSFEIYEKTLKFLIEKDFDEIGILLVAPKKSIEELQIYFEYGGTKEELIKSLILNS